jgi:hypothetical protein
MITKEKWEALTSDEKSNFWYKEGREFPRKVFYRKVKESFIEKPKMEIGEQAEYLLSIYKFKDGKIFTQGYFHVPDLRDEHNLYQALVWKYNDVTKEEFQTILQSIICTKQN